MAVGISECYTSIRPSDFNERKIIQGEGGGGEGSLILRSLFPYRVKKSLIKYACKKPFFIPFYCLEKVPIGRGFYTRTDESR